MGFALLPSQKLGVIHYHGPTLSIIYRVFNYLFSPNWLEMILFSYINLPFQVISVFFFFFKSSCLSH